MFGEFSSQALAVFDFVEVSGYGVGTAFAWEVKSSANDLMLSKLSFGSSRESCQDRGKKSMAYPTHSIPRKLARKPLHLWKKYKPLLHW
jgi:hypothetical protein